MDHAPDRAGSGPATALWPPDTRGRVIAALVAIIALLVVASLASWFVLREEEPSGGHTDRVVLAAAAVRDDARSLDSGLVTHLALTGGTPATAALEVWLTTIDGEPLPIDGGYETTLTLTSLLDGSRVDAVVEGVPGAPTPTFRSEQPGFTSEGWWRVRATVTTPEGTDLHTDVYLLLPDPNLVGFESPPAPETDPAAAALLEQAITQMSQWDSVRWWQWLSGGNDSMITADFAVTTTEANGEPASFVIEMLFGGGYEKVEGRVASPPRRDYYTTITIGDDAWTQTGDGAFRTAPPTQYLPINQYPQTYQGATSTVFGITDVIHGREAQVVSFHVPTLPSQSESWYTFWIDTETGDLLQLAMIANNHYMVWIYDDINEPFVIEAPEGVSATPVASPASD